MGLVGPRYLSVGDRPRLGGLSAVFGLAGAFLAAPVTVPLGALGGAALVALRSRLP